MELVYLWVEDYKNIKKQGFNFSARFACEFHYEYEEYTDEDGNKKERLKNDCKLDICDKKNKCDDNDYIENFFGEDINVTAIVGKNGSGKSSLLGSITDNTIKNNIIKVYYDKTLNKIFQFSREYTTISFFRDKLSIDVKEINYKTSDYQKIFFENISKSIDANWGNVIINVYKNELREMQLAIHLLKNNSLKFPFSIPTKITISLNTKSSGFFETIKYYILKHKFYIDFIKNDFFNIDRDNIDNKIKLIKFELLVGHILLHPDLSNKFYHIFYGETPSSIDDIISMFSKVVDSTVIKKIDLIINEINKNFTYDKHGIEFSIDIKNLRVDFIEKYQSVIYINSSNNSNDNSIFTFKLFPYPSDGEYKFLILFSKIYEYFNKNNILLLLDEEENYLHPNWQKKLINYIIIFFENNYKEKNIQLITTTHSPFLISDIPKQNIIFLDKDKNGYCKVVDGLMEKKQTFGANIHTLLSYSFFMGGSLMGEFAKEKIENIINFLQEKKTDVKDCDEAEKLISIIGEPILQMRLEKMLEKYKIKHNIISEDEIKYQIKELEHKLERIKNGKDKPDK